MRKHLVVAAGIVSAALVASVAPGGAALVGNALGDDVASLTFNDAASGASQLPAREATEPAPGVCAE
jgi:hypothetical protein